MSGVLTHTPAHIVQRLLIAIGQGALPVSGQTVTWPVSISSEPDSPDKAITVSNTQGRAIVRKQVDSLWVEAYGVQVRVRADTNKNAGAKAWLVAIALDGAYQQQVEIDGIRYLVHDLNRQGQPIDIGKNVPASKRNVFTINFLTNINVLT